MQLVVNKISVVTFYSGSRCSRFLPDSDQRDVDANRGAGHVKNALLEIYDDAISYPLSQSAAARVFARLSPGPLYGSSRIPMASRTKQ
jgi:hypothetical protein